MTFSHIDSYTSHVDIHSLSVTYSCGFCAKTFSQSIDLMKHKEVCQTYPCDMCKSKYSNKNSLILHKRKYTRSHTVFFCDICNTSFAFNKGLLRHKKTAGHLKMLESSIKTNFPSTS